MKPNSISLGLATEPHQYSWVGLKFLNLARWSTWPKTWVTGFDWVTRVKKFFTQNDVVLVKNIKSQQVTTGFLTGSLQVNKVIPGHDFPNFFLNPARFQPQDSRVLGRPVGSGFKTMGGAAQPPHPVLLGLAGPSDLNAIVFGRGVRPTILGSSYESDSTIFFY